eukprot:scaffold11734_cov20-Phaeocystis_antarctica.AAC.1
MAPHPPTHSTSRPPRLSFCMGRPQCEMPYEVRLAAGKVSVSSNCNGFLSGPRTNLAPPPSLRE